MHLPLGLTIATPMSDIGTEWAAERTIVGIECFERIFAARDTRPLRPTDLAAANRRHDEMLAHSPWFRFGSGMVSVADLRLQ
jgi:hypothetical protein